MVTGSPAPAARPPDSNRRSNKPIMEKRRRARINHCLNELKSLILDSMNKDPARHTKLEKADILEMTVKHVETLQRSQAALSVAADPGVLNKFKAGWGQCVGEIGRFPGIDTQVKKRLMEHLSTCIDRTSELSSIVTLVPTRLVNGDIALVVPCSPHREQHQQAHHGSPPPAPQAPCQQPSYPSSPPDLRAQASRSPVLASHPMSSQSPPVLYPVSSGSPTQEPALNPQPLDHRAQQPLSLVVKHEDKPWRPW